ncbi:hypothetical protein CRE_23956 [Caenorhabditis remanei]|uniref:Helicase ATP-binding domain-containing protein n=1 Tax=Caenorhabditis remanei TaxID=31234 RepID=E3MG55_CAERE|nr:hypothetical protein CRE_23956 [Caenorhabditis remanei]
MENSEKSTRTKVKIEKRHATRRVASASPLHEKQEGLMSLKNKLGYQLNYGIKCTFSTSTHALKRSSRVLKKQPKNKISLAPAFTESLKKWPKLLDAEIDAQFEKLDELIRNKSDWREIEERGLCIGNLIITSKHHDVYNGSVVSLTGDSIIKTRWLKNGIPVLLNRIDSDGRLKKITEGHVIDTTNGILKLCIYCDEYIDFSTTNYVLIPSRNGGATKFLQSILKDPSTLSSDSVHLINLAYRAITMPSIHDRKLTNLPETLNSSQQAAVSAALNTQRNLLCIQGPPGTGKTRVIAEIVHHLLKKKKKVLVCAPTHVAVRNAMQATMKRMLLEIPANIVEAQVCTLNSLRDEFQQHQFFPKLLAANERLAKTNKNDSEYKKVSREYYYLWLSIVRSIYSPRQAIYSTLGTSSIQKLNEYGWKADVMIVDEAAQCTEPATWVPVLTTPSCKKLILVGDQKQLPAVVFSEKAMQENMKVSLMEKLSSEFASNNINILLNEQYRMNEKIMNWPNEIFYDNKLTAHSSVADITLRDICPDIPEGFVLNNPILMIDMEKFENKSQEECLEPFSYSNTGEINVIKDYVIRLVTDVGVDPKDIAVIAPYYAQIERLRSEIPFRVDINTVDAFQGHEREVIIFCLVRDNDDGSIGFLRETRRLNVAVTRAKRQFVLIGSSRMMMRRNKDLRKLYKYLKSEKVVFGPEIFDNFVDAGLPSMNSRSD